MTLTLGTHPEATLEWARPRLEFARNLVAHGVDPSALKTALGKHRFGIRMRGWEAVQGRTRANSYLCTLCGAGRS